MSPTTARLQTPPGRGGIAVIALTGTDREAILAEVFRPLKSHVDAPDDAVQLGRLLDDDGQVMDEAVVARSGGEAIEINIHGGPVVVRAVLSRLAELGATVEPAKPAASESFQAAHPKWNNPSIGREMLEALPGAASELVVAAISQQWSAGLSQLASDADASSEKLRSAAERLPTMQKLLSPPEVVLVGPPNVGKSTLANVIVGREVSIVHDVAGTTRDWVREQALLCGVPIWLTDTAGLFEFPHDPHGVEAEAVRRARHRAESADLVVLLSAGEASAVPDWLHAKKLLRVAAKCDLAPPPGDFDVHLSAETGEGLDNLAAAILTALELDNIDPSTPAAFTPRQADLLTAAADAMDRQDQPTADEKLAALLIDDGRKFEDTRNKIQRPAED